MSTNKPINSNSASEFDTRTHPGSDSLGRVNIATDGERTSWSSWSADVRSTPKRIRPDAYDDPDVSESFHFEPQTSEELNSVMENICHRERVRIDEAAKKKLAEERAKARFD